MPSVKNYIENRSNRRIPLLKRLKVVMKSKWFCCFRRSDSGVDTSRWLTALILTTGLLSVGGFVFGQSPRTVKTPRAVQWEADELKRKHHLTDSGSSRESLGNGIPKPMVTVAPVGLLKDEKPTRKFRGRLPAHYAQVVNEQQRQFIYSLQWRYQQEIRKYEEHLKKLAAHRDQRIYDVLTPMQKEQLSRLQN